jgi:hypothetical protein
MYLNFRNARRVVSNDPEDMTVPDVDSIPATSLLQFQPLGINLEIPQLRLDRVDSLTNRSTLEVGQLRLRNEERKSNRC